MGGKTFRESLLDAWRRLGGAPRSGFGSVILAWTGFALISLVIALNVFALSRTEILRGPFYAEGGQSRLLIAPVGTASPPLFMDDRGGAVGRSSRAGLRMWLNGAPRTNGAAMHDEIREGAPMAYSHWDRSLYFSLPPDVNNDKDAIVTVRYRLVPRAWTIWGGLILGAFALVVGVRRARALPEARFLPHRVFGSAASALRRVASGPPGIAIVAILAALSVAAIIAAQWGERSYFNPAIFLALATVLSASVVMQLRDSKSGLTPWAAFKLPYAVLRLFGATILAAGCAFAIVAGIGVFSGDALPLAIPFRSDQAVQWARLLDDNLPLALLVLAPIGAASGWAATLRWSPQGARRALRREELRLVRDIGRFGPYLILTVFLAYLGATWAGFIGHGTTLSFAGLVPYSDAGGYYSDAQNFARDGQWTSTGIYRPLTTSLRQIFFYLSGMNHITVIVAQVLALAAAVYFATMAILRWRGVWPAVAFLAFSYVLLRPHLATIMTEAMAFIVAYASIPFFIMALRTKSRDAALLAIVLSVTAIWMRPGPVLAAPAFALWAALLVDGTWKERGRTFLLACGAVLVVIACSAALSRLYTPGASENFGYLLCGYSINGPYDACLYKYRDELTRLGLMGANASEKELLAWLYQRAFENIAHDPRPFLSIVLIDPLRFISDIPLALTRGYSQKPLAAWFPLFFWTTITIALGFASIRIRNWRREGIFWGLLFAAMIAGATLLYHGDSFRAYSLAFLFSALLLALCYSTPVSNALHAPRRDAVTRIWAARSVAAYAAALFVVPLVGSAISTRAFVTHFDSTRLQRGELAIGGGRRTASLLIVADNAELPTDTPAMHYSRFKQIIDVSGIEASQQMLTPTPPPLPFALFLGPRLDKPPGSSAGSALILLAPAYMVQQQDVPAWRVRYTEWYPSRGLFAHIWVKVVDAQPALAGTEAKSRK